MSMGGGTSHTTTTQELSPEQRALIEPVIPIAKNYLANPPKMYQGSGVAGFTDLQKQAQQMTLQAANSLIPQTSKIPGQFNNLYNQFGGVGAQYDANAASFGGNAKQFGNLTGDYRAQLPGYDKLRQQEDFLTSGAVLRPESNPYLQGAIEAASRPTIQQFQQQIIPGLQEDSITSGAYGGTRQGIASGIAGQAATQAIADIASRMSNENYQSGLSAMMGGMNAANETLAGKNAAIGGIGAALQGQQGALQGQQGALAGKGQTVQSREQMLAAEPGIMQGTLLPAQLKEAVGQQQQMMQQQLLSEKVQKYVNEQMIPFSVAQDVAQMAFGMPGGSTKSTSTQPGNPMMGMQMGMSALGMLPMLLGKSDRRLKHVIGKVAELVDGLSVYIFRYIGSVVHWVGLMADEVETKYPDAVRVAVDGYKTVNYSKVPSWKGSY
jgi:hypothetical protein